MRIIKNYKKMLKEEWIIALLKSKHSLAGLFNDNLNNDKMIEIKKILNKLRDILTKEYRKKLRDILTKEYRKKIKKKTLWNRK